jgi:cellulose synthase/poly-beta-1,6-N-acetylglucosamine synthase-like glycosyltransferase
MKTMAEKVKIKKSHNKLYNRVTIVISLLLALIIVFIVGYALIQYTNPKEVDYTSMLKSPDLINALHKSRASGVILAIHGWEHEDYGTLPHDEAMRDLHHATDTFNQSGLNTNVFVAPYQMSNQTEPKNVMDDLAEAGLTLPYDGDMLCEYTWEWRNMTTAADTRYINAVDYIKYDKPHTIMLHAQDWNIYTQTFLSAYLATTDNTNITIRMDDLDMKTTPELVAGMTKFTKYKSVGRVILSVIPAMALAKPENPKIFNIPINAIMEGYIIFFLVFAMFPMAFFVMWRTTAGFFNRKHDKTRLDTEIIYPKLLSIIVPAYNESESMATCIEALLNQDYKGAREIIVVNDGSTDNTAEIAARYPITLLDLKKNVGKASALNEGIKVALGDIIFFTDGDSNMCPDALTSMMRCFTMHPNTDVVTGQVLINEPEKFSFINNCQMIEYHIEQTIVRYIQSMIDEVVVCPGPITAVKRHVCDAIPYTNDTILEDADFTACIREKDFNIQFDPYAKVYTNAPTTVKSWYKQRTRWWYGNLQVWRVHKKWARKNPWMVYSYLSFVTSLCSLMMIFVMPYMIIQYGSLSGALVRSLIAFTIPVATNTLMTIAFFKTDKKRMLMVLPYMVVYPILRIFILSYFYVRYITGIGLNIRHGTRKIKAK